jgi:hypothetical protein
MAFLLPLLIGSVGAAVIFINSIGNKDILPDDISDQEIDAAINKELGITADQEIDAAINKELGITADQEIDAAINKELGITAGSPAVGLPSQPEPSSPGPPSPPVTFSYTPPSEYGTGYDQYGNWDPDLLP